MLFNNAVVLILVKDAILISYLFYPDKSIPKEMSYDKLLQENETAFGQD